MGRRVLQAASKHPSASLQLAIFNPPADGKITSAPQHWSDATADTVFRQGSYGTSQEMFLDFLL
jgi:hypothetical protein